MLVIAALAGIRLAGLPGATAALEGFVTELAAGRADEAARFLAPDLPGQEAVLSSLALLALNEAPRIEARASGHPLRFLLRREVAVPLVQPEETTWLPFGLIPTRGGWRISRTPDLQAHPGAMLYRDGATVRLLIAGRKLTVTRAAPGQAEPEIGLGVVVAGELISFQPGRPARLSKLLRVGDGLIETEREGPLLLGPGAAIYDLSAAAPDRLDRLIPGTTGLMAYYWRDLPYAVAQTEPAPIDRIRVVLGTTGFAGLNHERLSLSCPVGMTAHDRLAGREVAIPAGATAVVRPNDGAVVVSTPHGEELIRADHRLHFVPAAPGGRISVTNLARGAAGARFAPAYRGDLEVAPAPGGGLHLVNELPLNEYLYSVVPSEMPVSFGLTALKTQTLAARAYAVASLRQAGYAVYGAHVDDSIMSQVYNNLREQELSSRAVDETGLEVPTYEGAVVDARFFSTSAGFTANAHEVWSSAGGRFPGEAVPYLVARSQTPGVTALPDEAAVLDFLTRADLAAPDAAAPFFRWSVSLTREELEASIRANLAPRYAAQPGFVQTLDERGRWASRAVPAADPIGILRDIRVVARGQGGNLMAIELEGTNGTYRLIKEFNVRWVLRPVGYLAGRPPVRLRLGDGTTQADYPVLPSAFAFFQLQRDGGGQLQGVTIRGGGNGHGVGLSQTGAQGLARRGLGYRQIIQHYYPGATIVDLAAARPPTPLP